MDAVARSAAWLAAVVAALIIGASAIVGLMPPDVFVMYADQFALVVTDTLLPLFVAIAAASAASVIVRAVISARQG